VKDVLGANHLCFFVHQAVEELDLSQFEEAYVEEGRPAYAPALSPAVAGRVRGQLRGEDASDRLGPSSSMETSSASGFSRAGRAFRGDK
jgi:hypothetical protein